MDKIVTKRLILREWREADLEPWALLNADPRVREFFPTTLTREQSDQMVKRMQDKLEERGWGWWAVELVEDGQFIGFMGLDQVEKGRFPFDFAPTVEVGWRLAYPFWGKGYATEGAVACLQYGFQTLGLKEIIAFTVVQNVRSRAVMERIGMQHSPKDDFEHPEIPKDHKLSKHVLYRITANQPIKGFYADSI